MYQCVITLTITTPPHVPPLDSKAYLSLLPPVHLNPLLQILLEVGAVHNAVLDGVGAIDHQLDLVLLAELLNSLPLKGLPTRLSGTLSGHIYYENKHKTNKRGIQLSFTSFMPS